MNLLNRLLLILLDLILLLVAVVVLLVTLGTYQPEQLALSGWVQDRLQPFGTLDSTTQAWSTGICIALIVLGLVLLFFELKPAHREPRMTLKQDELGRVTVARNGVVALLNREATRVPGVMEGHAQFDDKDGQLRIRERILVDPTAELPVVVETVRERIKESVEHHLGRPVTSVSVDAQLKPLQDGRRVR